MSDREKLMNFICRNFLVEENEIDLNTSLIDQGIIDSFGLLEISTFLKKELSIETEQEEMNRENFGSFEKLLIYINTKRGGYDS
jgi:acyl carrier protein